ncbi:MAG: YbhB/YbcL family Raf kinase inhibitor-like protein [Alphaproteobacteria bacterium]|nr:YbhB/YbcL family Raf kinase inhibitor-like protein [Alphaproteobacteria bacterium]
MLKKSIFFAAFSCLVSSAFAADFTVTSTDVKNGKTMSLDQVYNSFGCAGKNISPQLSWHDAPTGTQSFAVTVYDPDAPTGSGWWHWTLFNIPATTSALPQGVSRDITRLPKGVVEGRTDFGSTGYGGACPPVGDKPHHYIVTVYALKTPKLDLDSNASGAMVGYNLNQNTLQKASITVTFGR